MPRSPAVPSVAVLLTCFKRRELTLRCLENVYAQRETEPRRLSVILVDDASPDGTATAVRERFPQVHIIEGSGNLFWNGGMRVAFGEAMRQGFDYHVWLNDDTMLKPEALDVILRTSRQLREKGIQAIVTASTCDSASGMVSYGGIRQVRGLFRRDVVLVTPSDTEALACDTMNGNFTLIPAEITAVLGNLEPRYSHSFGDLDYGFRAKKEGFGVYVAPGFLGICSDNPPSGTWRDEKKTFKDRWKHLNSVKGSPFGEWCLYCRRHQGPAWIAYAVSPYVKVLLGSVVKI